eukprot:2708585-Pleurochrysis_carterae.AAC.1
MNSAALNYVSVANVDDGTCIPLRRGCAIPPAGGASLYRPVNASSSSYTLHDPKSCDFKLHGCMQVDALNYESRALADDGSCIPRIYGCTDPSASNYMPEAT